MEWHKINKGPGEITYTPKHNRVIVVIDADGEYAAGKVLDDVGYFETMQEVYNIKDFEYWAYVSEYTEEKKDDY